MTARYACDVCGDDIRHSERERVVVGLPPGPVMTLLDFCPSCREVVASALVRLQALRADGGFEPPLPLPTPTRPATRPRAPLPAPWQREGPYIANEQPIPAAESLALPPDRTVGAPAVLARAAAYAIVAVALVFLVTWLLER